MLLIHVRRDVQRYPIIEKIIKWAEQSIVRSFISTQDTTFNEVYEIVSNFTPKMKSNFIKVANEVGFPLIGIDTLENILKDNAGELSSKLKFNAILLQEKNVRQPLFLENVSSGMYRTITLLILIEQLLHLNQTALLAIDDLGEGLDYSRATQIGKLLFEICEKNNIQLIATSNEEFMMNIVDIDEWNILVRKGETVRTITSRLCPEEFEEFKFSGLSNFDFFTSDFLNRISSKLFDDHK